MSKTSWALDDPDDAIELSGRKFGTGDDGAPMLCNLLCTDMGRHVHVAYCRTPPGQPCQPTEGTQHATRAMLPNRDQLKDWVTHSLHWRRMGKCNMMKEIIVLITVSHFQASRVISLTSGISVGTNEISQTHIRVKIKSTLPSGTYRLFPPVIPLC